MSARRILLAGATGLVGSECLRRLAADPTVSSVTAIVRQVPAGAVALPAHVRFEPVDFERLSERPALFAVDQVICALGTTIAKAGSRAAFRRVDFDYPLEIARLALEQGARHYLLVSAIRADSRSRVFYSRVKGDLERAVAGLGYRAVTILRPSLLLGDRAESRPLEALMKRLAWAVPSSHAPVQASDVAAALIGAARADRPGVKVVESAHIPRQAG